VSHGFLRAADCAITKYDVPVAGTGSGQGTMGSCTNPGGTIVGNYVDSNNVNHSYVRTPEGTISTFDAPGAGTGPGQGTVAVSNNPANAITGYYIDANNVFHGFLRIPVSPPAATMVPKCCCGRVSV
jgi:hypothetical protein